jgi:DNA-binding LytR/AlgR family response regulator
MEFARSMPAGPAVILTTAHRDYAVESYELDVVDYLIKPITFARFYRGVARFWQWHVNGAPIVSTSSVEGETYRDFNVDKRYVRIKLTDIRYIESLKDYVRIHTASARYVTKESLTELAASLPEGFLRCHRSYVVNLAFLTAYTARAIELGEDIVPIGASYRKAVGDRLG